MEHNEPERENLKDRVLEAIATEHIEAYSKTHFVLRMVLLVIIIVLALFVSVFLFNYLFFDLRISGRGSLLGFGPGGIIQFFQFFPWALLAVDIILIGLIQWLLRKFRLGYRVPVLYLLVVLVAAAAANGYVLDRDTGFNEIVLRQADEDHLPAFLGGWYESARRPPSGQGMCECDIVMISGNTLTAFDVHAHPTTSLTIIIPPNDAELAYFRVGDVVFVAGDRTASETIQAFGAAPFPAEGLELATATY